MKIRHLAVLGAIVSVALVVGLLSAERAPAQEKEGAEDRDAATHAAVAEIMKNLVGAKTGLFPGMRQRDVAKYTKDAANSVGEVWLPLDASMFAPEGDWQGVVKCYDDDEEPRMSEISVVLLTGEYDWTAARASVVVAGARLRYTMQVDEENRKLVWGEGPGGRSLWVAFGDGVIAIDCSKD